MFRVPKPAKHELRRLFKEFFKKGMQKQSVLKVSFKKKQQNGLAKPGHSAAFSETEFSVQLELRLTPPSKPSDHLIILFTSIILL
jgi:hypothetical protein